MNSKCIAPRKKKKKPVCENPVMSAGKIIVNKILGQDAVGKTETVPLSNGINQWMYWWQVTWCGRGFRGY